jgi:hypothetical protein
VSDKGHVWGIEIACDPSLVQSCFDRMQRLIQTNEQSDALNVVRNELLTMQRERDEAREQTKKAIEIGAKHVHGLQAERDAAREQLAASERTCAELRESVERSVAGMNALSIQSVQLVDENARLQAELARLESGDALKK